MFSILTRYLAYGTMCSTSLPKRRWCRVMAAENRRAIQLSSHGRGDKLNLQCVASHDIGCASQRAQQVEFSVRVRDVLSPACPSMSNLTEGFAVKAIHCPRVWMCSCHCHDFGMRVRAVIAAHRHVWGGMPPNAEIVALAKNK